MTYILYFTVPKIQTDTDFSGESTLYQLVGRDHWQVTRSTCGKMTPTTETVRVVRGQWSHISGGGTHMQTCKHVPAACVRMHTAPTSQGQPGHARRQRLYACVWSSMKCHRSNSKETPLQTCSSPWGTLSFHLAGQSRFPRQTQTSWSYPLPIPERRHRVSMLDGSSQNYWVLISYHLLLLKCLLISAWAPLAGQSSLWTAHVTVMRLGLHVVITLHAT